MFSMTGFGSGKAAEDGREITVELKSVNHRFLDVACRLPKSLSFLETTIRSTISEKLARGHIDVFVTYSNTREDARQVRVDFALAQSLHNAVEHLASLLKLDHPSSITDYLSYPGVLTVIESDDDIASIRGLTVLALNGALNELQRMRAIEGGRLHDDLKQKLTTLESFRRRIEVKAPLVVESYKERLSERLACLLNGEIDESRFATEVAIFADRTAIDEELTRLGSHIEQAYSMIEQNEPIGRKIDFLIQEMNRELNTIGSKAGDTDIIGSVLSAKSEVEKIREQAQNIE